MPRTGKKRSTSKREILKTRTATFFAKWTDTSRSSARLFKDRVKATQRDRHRSGDLAGRGVGAGR